MSSGGKGGSKSSTSTSTGSTSTEIPSWLEQGSQQAVSTAEDLSQRAYTPYLGEQVAGTTADTQQAYQQIRNMQGMTDPSFNAAQNAWGGVLGNLQSLTPEQQNAITNSLQGNYAQQVIAPTAGLLGGYLQNAGPATADQVTQNQMTMMSPFSQAVINPTLKLGQQQLAQNLQQVGAGANQAGAFGGARQGVQEGVAQAQAALGSEQYIGNLLNTQWQNSMTPAYNLANQASQQGYGAAGLLAGQLGTGYQQSQAGAQNMMQQNLGLGTSAAQQLPALATQQATEAGKEAAALQSIGNEQQQLQQAQDNAAYGNFQDAQNWPVQNLDILLSALGAVPYSTKGTSSSTTTGTQTSTPSTGSQIMGGIGTVASIASMFSDERLKEDIHRVGETDAGTPVYTYRYKFDPSRTPRMGVMAQDLLARQPEAVTDMGGGLLGVDYSQVA